MLGPGASSHGTFEPWGLWLGPCTPIPITRSVQRGQGSKLLLAKDKNSDFWGTTRVRPLQQPRLVIKKKISWIWRFSCISLYCSILNLHPLHAKHIIKPLASSGVHNHWTQVLKSPQNLTLFWLPYSFLSYSSLKQKHLSSKPFPKTEFLKFRLEESNIPSEGEYMKMPLSY